MTNKKNNAEEHVTIDEVQTQGPAIRITGTQIEQTIIKLKNRTAKERKISKANGFKMEEHHLQ